MAAFAGWDWGGYSPTLPVGIFLIGCAVLYIRGLLLALGALHARLNKEDRDSITGHG